jgi:predicted phage terminase large subunit-like protein
MMAKAQQLPPTRKPHPDDWRPHAGPQTRFLSLTCFEALYGGAAGGGKSDALLVDAIRCVGKGYGRNYHALLLRREFPDLQMSLILRSHTLYPRLGARWKGDEKIWTFPDGEVVRFGHAQHEYDVHQYQGAEFQFVGFDEVTSFTEYQYTYLISRLRSSYGVPVRLRAATNPGGPGHEWVFKRFRFWLDPNEPVRAMPSQPIYTIRDSSGVEHVVEKGTVDSDGKQALGRTFVPARLEDNPSLSGTNYARGLLELDPVTREQLKNGNWLIKPASGLYFKRGWFKIVDASPVEATRIRYWDRASTEEPGSSNAKNKDPDWTVGAKLALAPDRSVYVEHVHRFRGNPGEVERAIKMTAELDGKNVWIGIEQDPGSAGKFEASYYVKELQAWNVKAYPATKDKITRAGPFSSQSLAGNVHIVRGDWNDQYIQELEGFPEASHDDQVDASSGGFNALTDANLGPTDWDYIDACNRAAPRRW